MGALVQTSERIIQNHIRKLHEIFLECMQENSKAFSLTSEKKKEEIIFLANSILLLVSAFGFEYNKVC